MLGIPHDDKEESAFSHASLCSRMSGDPQAASYSRRYLISGGPLVALEPN